MAQTRLESRGHRPDVELCRDPPHHRLVQEVNELQESIELLNRKLNEAENAHQVRYSIDIECFSPDRHNLQNLILRIKIFQLLFCFIFLHKILFLFAGFTQK